MTRPEPRATRGASAVSVAAQAKVNLRLCVLARETSGYHQIETLMLRLALADAVRVRRSASRTLDLTGDAAAIGPVERNLAWRAAVAYCEASRWREGFAIELEKRIPIGGGLGGGSADAGAVLRALDAMATEPIGEPALLRIASTLGADVPFLTSEHAYVLAWGRGERMLALEPPPPRGVALFVPSFGVATADAYRWLADAHDLRSPALESATALRPARLSDWKQITELATNDFEPVVAGRHPVIGQMLRGLRADMHLPLAMLAGSGSTVFAVVPDGVPAIDGAGSDMSALAIATTARLVVTATVDRVEPVVVVH